VTRDRPAPAAPEPNPDTIDACRRGDRQALEAVFRTHAPALERLIVRLAGPNADVEDLLQTALMEAVRAFPRFQGKASVATWLGSIGVHVVHQHLRRPDNRRRRVRLELVPDRDQPIDAAPEPDSLAHARRQLERVYRHLDAIAVKRRVAFILFAFEGRSIDEVAALTGASRMAAKSRIFWARRELLARVGADPALRDLVARQEGRS
jgi:RNA polymerase sigma-70 factor (ECF subfamily)